MKRRIRHCIFVLLILFVIVGIISVFLNNISFNPNFSMIDVISGATKKTNHRKNGNVSNSEWDFSRDDIVLYDTKFAEEEIKIGKTSYWILRKISDTKDIVILSNKENRDYQYAVKDIAGYLKSQGYNVRIKDCSEIMMLSLAHTGHFDVFLMREEEQQ